MSTNLLQRSLCALVLVAATSGVASRASAQSTDQERTTAALAIFNNAQELASQGKYEEACPKFEEVLKLEPKAIGTQLQLADCYDHVGRFASAWTTYTLAGDAAAAAGQQDRTDFARKRAGEIKPKVPELTVEVPAELQKTPGLKIERNGVLVGRAQWGLPVPVDPGSYSIAVSAPGKTTWKTSVKLEAGARNVKVPLPALVDAPAAPADPSNPHADDRVEGSSAPPAWAWIAGAAGLALTGVGIGFAVDGALADCDVDAAGKCDPYKYTQGDVEDFNARRGRDLPLAIGFGAAGLAGLTIGIIGLVTSGEPEPPAKTGRLFVAPWLTERDAGVVVMGGF